MSTKPGIFRRTVAVILPLLVLLIGYLAFILLAWPFMAPIEELRDWIDESIILGISLQSLTGVVSVVWGISRIARKKYYFLSSLGILLAIPLLISAGYFLKEAMR